MANQDPGIDLGWLVSGFDARNGSITGTTRAGPNGSGQFLAVQISTAADKTVTIVTSTGQKADGILQNKPSTGIAADVRFVGVSKAVAGSTLITAGGQLEVASSGTLIPYSSTAGVYPIGKALESATAVGQVFSVLLFGGGGVPSV